MMRGGDRRGRFIQDQWRPGVSWEPVPRIQASAVTKIMWGLALVFHTRSALSWRGNPTQVTEPHCASVSLPRHGNSAHLTGKAVTRKGLALWLARSKAREASQGQWVSPLALSANV